MNQTFRNFKRTKKVIFLYTTQRNTYFQFKYFKLIFKRQFQALACKHADVNFMFIGAMFKIKKTVFKEAIFSKYLCKSKN